MYVQNNDHRDWTLPEGVFVASGKTAEFDGKLKTTMMKSKAVKWLVKERKIVFMNQLPKDGDAELDDENDDGKKE